ncbi:MAG: M6 family metalloprotease domain-containing protein [Prevotella sp.]|nr:M6 family metalloprotease domain-containing protein [Prevotella sp.]
MRQPKQVGLLLLFLITVIQGWADTRKSLYLILATLCCASMLAIPARRGQWQTITLSDGSQVRVELRGDERCHWWEDSLGNRYCNRGRTKEDGVRRNDTEIWELVNNKEQSLGTSRKGSRARKNSPSSLLPTPYSDNIFNLPPSPFNGSRKGIIILVEFANKQFRDENDRDLFDRIANERGFSERGFKGCVSDYFRDQSGGMLDLTFDVIGPVTVSNDYEYYGKNVGPDNYDAHPDEMIVEACKLVDDEVDFSDYDWNHDGYVEQVVVIYAGQGEANGGSKNTIWPHEWELVETDYGKTLRLDKVRINTYACSPELSSSTRIDGIGTLCHEFAHCLGLPDMYDEDGKNYGMSYWDLMDLGSYNGDGFRPAGFTAYEKMFCGWQQPIVLSKDTVVLEMHAISEGGDTYIIYNNVYPNEYYMLENRQKTGWDKSLLGSGLLITHIDYNPDIWTWNVVNSFSTYYDIYDHEYTNDHERCTIFHADNDNASTLIGIIGDPYPYLFNDSLTVNSRPATTLYHKDSRGNDRLQVAIKKIKKNEDNTISFQFFQRSNYPSGMHHVKVHSNQDNPIYSMEGIFLGTDKQRLPKGVYIIGGKKTVIP